jgi:hypothetical protein
MLKQDELVGAIAICHKFAHSPPSTSSWQSQQFREAGGDRDRGEIPGCSGSRGSHTDDLRRLWSSRQRPPGAAGHPAADPAESFSRCSGHAGERHAHLRHQVRGTMARRGQRFQVGCDAGPARRPHVD